MRGARETAVVTVDEADMSPQRCIGDFEDVNIGVARHQFWDDRCADTGTHKGEDRVHLATFARHYWPHLGLGERVQCCHTQVVTLSEHHHWRGVQVGYPERPAAGKRMTIG